LIFRNSLINQKSGLFRPLLIHAAAYRRTPHQKETLISSPRLEEKPSQKQKA